MSFSQYSIGFYGFGHLAHSLWSSWQSTFLHHYPIYFTKKTVPSSTEQGLTFLQEKALLDHCDIIILAVKPQQLCDVIPILNTISWKSTCLVSVLAGTSIHTLLQHIPHLHHIIRVMPNTCAQYQESMTVYCASPHTNPHYISFINHLFSLSGKTLCIQEEQMNFCTSLCGSGPAFFYELLNSLLELSQSKGFSPEKSRLLINQLIQGIATSINQDTRSFDDLIHRICSPNGTTQCGLDMMNSQLLSDSFKQVFESAEKRAQELAS